MKKFIKIFINMALFILCMRLIIVNQSTVSKINLLKMMIGLSGLLIMLYLYNKGKK